MNFWLRIATIVLILANASFSASGLTQGYSETWEHQDQPSILFSSLLNNIAINANGGWVKIGQNIVNLNLPVGMEGSIVLKDKGGRQICQWPWTASRNRYNPPYQEFVVQNPKKPDGSVCADARLTDAGDYRFDIVSGTRTLLTFPVSIRILPAPAGSGREPRYLVDGAWNDWGYLYYEDANPSSSLAWKLWLRAWEYEPKQRSVEVELVREADKKLIAENRVRTSVTFPYDWKRLDFELFHPTDKSLFRARELLERDGDYTLTMRMNGEVYGVWKFSVSGGRLQLSDRALRGSAEPERFIEGANETFWYKKIG